jgi:hypothetical protein
VLSGDHAGDASLTVLLVSLVWFVPSAFMTQISVEAYSILQGVLLSILSKAMFWPSADQAGFVSWLPDVMAVSPVPSGFIVAIGLSHGDPDPTWNAIFPFAPGKAAWAGAEMKRTPATNRPAASTNLDPRALTGCRSPA